MRRGLPRRDLPDQSPVLVRCSEEPLPHFSFRIERLDDPQTPERLLHLRHRVAPLFLRLKRVSLELLSQRPHSPGHRRHHEQREQRQLPAREQQRPEIEQNQNRVLDEHVQRARD